MSIDLPGPVVIMEPPANDVDYLYRVSKLRLAPPFCWVCDLLTVSRSRAVKPPTVLELQTSTRDRIEGSVHGYCDPNESRRHSLDK